MVFGLNKRLGIHSQADIQSLINQTEHLESQLDKILASLTPVLTYGHYDGGYEHTYLHKIIYQTASTKQTALQNALIKSEFLQITEFKSFYPDQREYLFQSFDSEEEGQELYQKY
ncbi:MAG: hypothetical protein AAFS12_18205 [Cyanobacteria bacterium J06632_19]